MASPAYGATSASAVRAATVARRHSALVRVTHWISAAAILALLVTGMEIVVSHPRFYWGETGNVNMQPLFSIPIPSSRAAVPTGYGYVLPDQNGWSRSLHFEAAWALVLVGIVYLAYGALAGHFRRNLWPDLSNRALSKAVADHLRFKRPGPAEAWSYNALQRLAYLFVVFVAVPLLVWTGLAMSPAVVAGFPALVTTLGGQQSARTIHFLDSLFLLLFLGVHVGMVVLAGFRQRMRAMITGRVAPGKERV
jgi:thiosulfate reductase cytochrome b subunit